MRPRPRGRPALRIKGAQRAADAAPTPPRRNAAMTWQYAPRGKRSHDDMWQHHVHCAPQHHSVPISCAPQVMEMTPRMIRLLLSISKCCNENNDAFSESLCANSLCVAKSIYADAVNDIEECKNAHAASRSFSSDDAAFYSSLRINAISKVMSFCTDALPGIGESRVSTASPILCDANMGI